MTNKQLHKLINEDGTDKKSVIYCEEHGLVHPLYYSRLCLQCQDERCYDEEISVHRGK